MKSAPSIPKENFTALTRLDQNRARKQLAMALSECSGKPVAISDVSKVSIWGNHSATQFPDTFHAEFRGASLRDALKTNAKWLDGEFV